MELPTLGDHFLQVVNRTSLLSFQGASLRHRQQPWWVGYFGLGLVARCVVHAILPRLNHLKLRLRQATSIRFPGTFLGPTFRWMMRSDAFVNFCWARFDELYMVMEICDSDLKKLCRTDTRLQLGICTGMKIQP